MDILTKQKLQKKTARLAILTAIFLALIKLVIAFFTASLAILASAIDSVIDMGASAINYFSIKKSHKPADADHHYGHGKAESLAGFIQGELMLGSSAYLIYEAVRKIYLNQFHLQVQYLALVIMLFSAIISLLLFLRMKSVAQKTGSVALKADSIHYMTDVLSNFAVFLSLLIVYFFDFYIIDPVLSILIAIYLAYSAWEVLQESVDVLMDKSLDQDDLNMIHEVLDKFFPHIVSYHNLQTRKAGQSKFIDMHLVMPNIQTLQKGHDIAESIIHAIHKKLPNADINIHLDPKDDSHEPTNRSGGIQGDLGEMSN